jgi:hypothetical protein
MQPAVVAAVSGAASCAASCAVSSSSRKKTATIGERRRGKDVIVLHVEEEKNPQGLSETKKNALAKGRPWPVHTSAAHVTLACLSHTSKIGSHQEKTADNAESRAYTSELDIAQNTKEHEAAVTDSCICTRCRDALGGIHRGTRLYENQESGRTKRKNDERRVIRDHVRTTSTSVLVRDSYDYSQMKQKRLT